MILLLTRGLNLYLVFKNYAALTFSLVLILSTLPGDSIEAQVGPPPIRSLGALHDEARYLKVAGPPPLARGDFTEIPSRVSLKQFAPSPGNQGQQGSCVGWATAYAARTLLAAKAANITSHSGIRQSTQSPAFIYNQLVNGNCGEGTYTSEALKLMRDDGVLRWSDFPYDEQSCTRLPSASQRAQAGAFRIKGFNRLWGSGGRNKHISARRALAAGHPVVIGMGVSETFMRLGPNQPLYIPSSKDILALQDMDAAYDSGYLGGHAMTVVGYDDDLYGGAFEVINSWGETFGDGGYVWITYSDFNGFMHGGYEVVPLDPPPPPRVVDMEAQMSLLALTGEMLDAQLVDSRYVLKRPMPSGTRFRTTAKTAWPANMYLIGGDASGDYVELFPRTEDVEPHVYKGATLLLPGPTESYFTRLNDVTGTDFYIVLVSQNPLNIGEIAWDLKKAQGPPLARLQEVLRSDLVALNDIEYSQSNLSFKAVSGDASIVPIIVEIDHVSPDSNAGDKQIPLIVLKEPALEAFDAAVDENLPILVDSSFVQLTGVAQDSSAISELVVENALSLQFSSRGPFRAEIELPQGPGPHMVVINAQDEFGNKARKVFSFSVR